MSGQITTKKADNTLRSHIESEGFAEQIAKVLPTHLTPQRMVRVAVTAMLKNPKLMECNQASFFNSMLTCSQFGLEPDGRLAHLIPFNNRKRGIVECQLIIDYKGLVALALRSGTVSNIHANKVCEEDVFVYNKGQIVDHKIDFRKPRGKVFAYYCIVRMKDGNEKCDVMQLEEVDAIRKRSLSANNGPWVTDYDEMAKKSVFRRLSKWIELSPEFRQALDHDDKDYVVDGNVQRTVRQSDAVVAMLDNFVEQPADDVPEEPQVTTDPTVKRLDDAKAVESYKSQINKSTTIPALSKVAVAIEADANLNEDSRKLLISEVNAFVAELDTPNQ
jgi:recombination protein RecT